MSSLTTYRMIFDAGDGALYQHETDSENPMEAVLISVCEMDLQFPDQPHQLISIEGPASDMLIDDGEVMHLFVFGREPHEKDIYTVSLDRPYNFGALTLSERACLIGNRTEYIEGVQGPFDLHQRIRYAGRIGREQSRREGSIKTPLPGLLMMEFDGYLQDGASGSQLRDTLFAIEHNYDTPARDKVLDQVTQYRCLELDSEQMEVEAFAQKLQQLLDLPECLAAPMLETARSHLPEAHDVVEFEEVDHEVIVDFVNGIACWRHDGGSTALLFAPVLEASEINY